MARLLVTVALCAALLLAPAPAHAKKKKSKHASKSGEDLPADAPLQIGIKRRATDGCPRKVRHGDRLTVNYIGRLYKDGKKFDSSYDRDQPFEFTFGTGEVIKGWDEGLHGMCVGERRKLTVPAGKAYGDAGAGSLVPAGATLVFKVTLVANDGPEPPPTPAPTPAPTPPPVEEEEAADDGDGAGDAAGEEEVLDLDAEDGEKDEL